MKQKILIIDDEFDLCLLLKKYLVSKDYEVDMANTLNEGLGKVNTFHPDIVFLDNNLPDGLGWDKADELSAIYPLMKINLISGFQPSFKMEKLKSNIRIIEKPLSSTIIDQSLN